MQAKEIKQKIDDWIEQGYFAMQSGRLVATKKLYEALADEKNIANKREVRLASSKQKGKFDTLLVDSEEPGLYPAEAFSQAVVTTSEPTLRDRYKKFLLDIDLPEFSQNGRGNKYRINMYSRPAQREFGRIMNSDISYDDLVLATKLYYHSSGDYKVTISNFIEKGMWESYYDKIQSNKDNLPELVAKTLKKENNDFSRFTQ